MPWQQRAFSLIELILALVIAGILSAGLMMWIARPLQALQESHRRAAAIGQAGNIAARVAAELPNALPNSARVACGGRCLEFLPVVDYGDYRTALPGDILDLATADNRFDVLMPLPAAPQAGQQVVIGNLNALPGGSFSAYSQDANNNRSSIVSGATGAQIRIAPKQFPAASPTQRFYIVDTPVSYLCQPAANGGAMRRYAGYAIQAAQPANTSLGDVLAAGMIDCRFGIAASNRVTLHLTVGDGQAAPLHYFMQTSLRHAP
ncbi:MAG: type II secretion system protein [Woeseiaceae bacterium]